MNHESSNEGPSFERQSNLSSGGTHRAALSVAAQKRAISEACAQRGWPAPVFYEDEDEERSNVHESLT